MAGRQLPVRKRVRKCEADTAAATATAIEPVAHPSAGFSMSETLCAEYLRWESALLHQPLQEIVELSADTTRLLQTASAAGDTFAASMYAKVCLIRDARAFADRAILCGSIRKHFHDVATHFGWKEMPGMHKKMVFSTVSRTCCGTRMEALIHFAAASDAPACLKETIANNCVVAKEIVDAEILPVLEIDMALVLHEGTQRSFGVSTGTRVVNPTDPIHRAFVPLNSSGVVSLRETCPPELLLVVGAMLVPLGMQRHAWKTLIVTSGTSARPHLIDRICEDLVGLGVTTDLNSVLRNVGTAQQERPFVLKLDRWNTADERFLDELHAILKIGVIVIIRSDIGVPREICLQPRLRLCTTHLRDVTVTAEVWNSGKGALFTEALREYAEHAHRVPVAVVPFKVALDGHLFRPVPRRGMSANCFYLSEMIQIEYGIGLGQAAAGESVDMEHVTESLRSYADHHKVFEASKVVTPEDVLQAAQNVREGSNAVVTFCKELKVFRNLKRFRL